MIQVLPAVFFLKTMSKKRRKNGSSNKPDVTTSDTNTTLKVTPEAPGGHATARDTACDTKTESETSGDTTRAATIFTTTNDTTHHTSATGEITPTRDSLPASACTDTASTNGTSPARPDDTDPTDGLIGRLLLGAYLVGKEIDRRNSGRVFEGTDIRNESQVAIVILPAPESQNSEKHPWKKHSKQGVSPVKNNCADRKTNQPQNKSRSQTGRNEAALCQLEAKTGIKIRAYECEEQFCYCVIALESLDEFENPQPKAAVTPMAAAAQTKGKMPTSVAVSAILAASLFGWLAIGTGLKTAQQAGKRPVNIASRDAPEEVGVPLTNDSDLNPTNDFIAFDPSFADGFSTSGKINMTSINRVIAQSVIVSLNARDINTSSAVFHAQCVASAAKGVARSLRTELVKSSTGDFIIPSGFLNTKVQGKAPCYVGEAQSTNVFFPNSLTSSIPVSYPSSLKSQSPGGKRRNGDEYMAGYSKIQVPIGDTTIDIAGVPVFPLRSNEPLTLDDIKASKDADPTDSDYLPPNSILVGRDTDRYGDLVACSLFGSADKDYAACIPRGYIRITNGPQQRDDQGNAYQCPVSDSRNDSFVGDWQSSLGLPWEGELNSNHEVFRSPPQNPYYLRYGAPENEIDTKTPGSPLALLDQIGKDNSAGEEFFLRRVAARMKQVDPNITITEVKVALSQGMLKYAGETIYLYSPGPGAKLQCDPGYPYMSKTIPNDGLNSAVEISCERVFNLSVKDANQKSVFLAGAQRAIFTPATGWRNLLGDITFEYETKNGGTFSRP